MHIQKVHYMLVLILVNAPVVISIPFLFSKNYIVFALAKFQHPRHEVMHAVFRDFNFKGICKVYVIQKVVLQYSIMVI